MDAFRKLAEERIREAIGRGDFDDLPGRGRPLELNDDRGVPEDLRMAYRIMRNAGCLPPEAELQKEICSLRELLGMVDDRERRVEIMREIDFRLLKFNEMRKTPFSLDTFPGYRDKILSRLSRGRSAAPAGDGPPLRRRAKRTSRPEGSGSSGDGGSRPRRLKR